MPGEPKVQRNRSAEAGEHSAHKDVHREALERERWETEVAWYRHFENPDAFHDRNCVVPFRMRPVIPEFPQQAAQQAAEGEVDNAIEAAAWQQRLGAETGIDRIEQKD